MKSTQRCRSFESDSAAATAASFGRPYSSEQIGDFPRLLFGDLDRFALLPRELRRVVLGVRPGGEIAAEPHRDRARRDLGQTGGDDHPARVDRPRQAGREREGDRQAVGHSDHDVADRRRRGEVLFEVGSLRHGRRDSNASGATRADPAADPARVVSCTCAVRVPQLYASTRYCPRLSTACLVSSLALEEKRHGRNLRPVKTSCSRASLPASCGAWSRFSSRTRWRFATSCRSRGNRCRGSTSP